MQVYHISCATATTAKSKAMAEGFVRRRGPSVCHQTLDTLTS